MPSVGPFLPPDTTQPFFFFLYSPLVPCAWAGRFWLPAVGPVPGAQAGGGWGVLRAERPPGRGGRGRQQCHRQGQLSPRAGARGARAVLPHKLLGRPARQRCRARRLPQRWGRRWLRARERPQLRTARSSARSAQAWPRGEERGAGARKGPTQVWARDSPRRATGRPQLHPAQPLPRPALYPARRAPGRRRRGSRPSHRLL